MRWVFIVVILISVQTISAQREIDSLRSFYIEEYPNNFFIWPVVKYRSLTFSVQDKNEENDRVVFKPNNTASAGFGFYVFEIGFELTFAIPVDEQQKQIFGETEAKDIQLNILTKSWGADLYYQKYSSFYKDDLRVKGAIEGVNRPDIATRNFGISGVYVFNNKKFSLRSAYNYAERQLKRGGSCILYGTINSFKAEADSAMLSTTARVGLGEGSDFEDIRCTTLSVAPGYSYNYIVRKFFVNGTFTVGPAHHWVYYQTEDKTEHYDVSFNVTTTLRFALGYNSDRVFGGIGFMVQSRAVAFEDTRFESASNTFRILIGYRFIEKGIFKKRAWDFVPFLKNS